MHKSLLRNLLMVLFASPFFLLISCNKETAPVTPDTAYMQDSIRIVDSLSRINAAGIVNYTVAVVNGNSSALFNADMNRGAGQDVQGTQEGSSTLEGAIVTATQFGKTQVDTTDESGLASFTGFFRGGISVSIRKEGFTPITYIAHVAPAEATANNSIRWMGNIIPVFEVAGTRTSTITGRATIETDLTNTSRELVPAGTKVTAAIEPNVTFYNKFLRLSYSSMDPRYFGGEISSASYTTGSSGTVDANGNYTLTVPGAVAGLTTRLHFSDVAADQKLYEVGDPNTNGNFNRVKTYRNIFSATSVSTPSAIPAAGGARVFFVTGSGATATASISGDTGIERINIISGGTGYTSAPKVVITGGGGNGATATATVSNGVVTAINISSPGRGYTSKPTVSLISGSGAAASTTIGGGGSVLSVVIRNSGSGFTTAPAVTFSAPALEGGVQATGTAVISNGKVTGITITEPGSGYTSNPTVTIEAAPTGGINATATAQFSGQSVESIRITNAGTNYTGVPAILFSQPDLPNGVRATGRAIVDVASGIVTGIQITDAGSGYLTAPSVSITAGFGAAADAVYLGRGVTGITLTNGGSDYTSVPTVKIVGDGTGATATAVISNGRVIGVNITNAGSGYSTAPAVEFISGAGAQASVTVENGKITAINVVNGGFNYTGAPTIKIEAIPGAPGAGATATATVSNGAVTGVEVATQGEGYIGGNVPSVAEPFVIKPVNSRVIDIFPGITYIRDVHYGTGLRQQ